MDNRFNTIAGWVLGAGIVLLGAVLFTGELFHAERPETMGYPIEGVEEEGGAAAEAQQPIAFYLQTADAARGEAEFRRCATCHTINQGGANGLGPNLFGVMGSSLPARGDFNYSEALRSKGGTWDWDQMSAWIASPRTFAPGTRMTFAGISDPQARANLLAYLNAQGGRLQIPPPPAAAPAGNEAAAAGNEAAGNDSAGNAQEPALQQQNRSEGSTKGPAATDTSGRAAQEPHN
jgi:cytochrome c